MFRNSYSETVLGKIGGYVIRTRGLARKLHVEAAGVAQAFEMI